MHLDKETYERAGLTGKPHGVKGKRGLKPRWSTWDSFRVLLMTTNLFLKLCNSTSGAPPCSTERRGLTDWHTHAKTYSTRLSPGFFTILLRVGDQTRIWITLMAYVRIIAPTPDPLSRHYPIKYTSHPEVSEGIPTKIPLLKPPPAILDRKNSLDLDEFATDIYEWLSLIRLDSPRVNGDDKVDPYLSGYAVPGDPEDVQKGKLCRISWQGFIPPKWTQHTLVDVIHALPSKSWFSLSTTSFVRGITGDSADCTILRPPNSTGDYFLWDIKRHD